MLPIVMIAMPLLAATGPSRAEALSVCEVLADDPTRLNGKVISVRGVLGAAAEGMWLTGECKTHLVTKGLEWGNDLSVYVPAADERVARSWEGMSSRLKAMHASLSGDRVWVTIIGRLETRQSMEDEVVQMPYGPRRAGFGHMGDSPAEITVISIEDVRVERAKRPAPKRDTLKSMPWNHLLLRSAGGCERVDQAEDGLLIALGEGRSASLPPS